MFFDVVNRALAETECPPPLPFPRGLSFNAAGSETASGNQFVPTSGTAADIVSVKGETRAERWVSSEQLWKWIDTHQKELGIGRPYGDRDAPHVAPIDGKEYAAHRVEPSAQYAEVRAKKHQRLALRNDHGMAKHMRAARSSRAQL